MYEATARFLATKLKEYCEEQADCSKCPFAYHPTLIGVRGEYVPPYRECRFYGSPNEWIIPKEDRT